MSEIRVTCRNEEEAVKVLEIAEKEGYTWNNKKATSFKPYANYPYYIMMCKNIKNMAIKQIYLAYFIKRT